jgi:7-cyano-7-deazaguanine synthase in queuosine biosynthesis
MKTLLLASGGLKSTFIAAYCLRDNEEVTFLFIDHDQVALEQEYHAASEIARFYKCKLIVDALDLPSGWPPFKSTYMWIHALMKAHQMGCDFVYDGLSKDDRRLEAKSDYFGTLRLLIDKIQPAFVNWELVKKVELEALTLNLDAERIIRLGEEIGVPWRLTWSCEEGGEIHCGTCRGCKRRRWGFFRNARMGVVDPTVYRVREEP